MNELRIPFGLCDVIFDGVSLTNLADKAVFQAIPSYKKLHGGKGNTIKRYLLEDYKVSMTLSLTNESYETFKLTSPSLKDFSNGLYDNPSKVDISGKVLTIHPRFVGNIKDYDITLFSAIVDPEQSFVRTYDKNLDKFEIKFIGQPAKDINNEGFNSYFYIGDAEKAGVI